MPQLTVPHPTHPPYGIKELQTTKYPPSNKDADDVASEHSIDIPVPHSEDLLPWLDDAMEPSRL
jgi:hypothetical protein